MDELQLYKRALEREKLSRVAAEKLLDEKTREVYSSMSMIQDQFNELKQQKNNLELLAAVSDFTQEKQGFSASLTGFISILGTFTSACYVVVYDLQDEFGADENDKLCWFNDNFPNIKRTIETAENSTKSSVFTDAVQTAQTVMASRKHDKDDAEGDDDGIFLNDEDDEIEKTEIASHDRHDDDSIFLTEEVHGVVVFPVVCYKKVVAAVEVGISDWQHFPDSLRESAKVAVSQLGVALERRKSVKKLEQNHDKLQQAHGELKKAQEQLVNSEKLASIGQLAAGVAHEINNPIGYVISNINTLKEYLGSLVGLVKLYMELESQLPKPGASQYANLLEKISSIHNEDDVEFIIQDVDDMLGECAIGMDRVKDIVSNLKNFARTGSGNKANANINQCLENVAKIAWNEVKYHNEIVTDLKDIPEIFCNIDELGQVFLNLIINANQAMESGGAINIKTSMNDNSVIVKVSDTGCGIPEDKVKNIFDPFFTTKPIGVGTGLGLSIAYGIIEDHKGVISVASEEGVGTEFTIQLPIVRHL